MMEQKETEKQQSERRCFDDYHEDEDDMPHESDCPLCGAVDEECDYDCPNNESAFARFIREGY